MWLGAYLDIVVNGAAVEEAQLPRGHEQIAAIATKSLLGIVERARIS